MELNRCEAGSETLPSSKLSGNVMLLFRYILRSEETFFGNEAKRGLIGQEKTRVGGSC